MSFSGASAWGRRLSRSALFLMCAVAAAGQAKVDPDPYGMYTANLANGRYWNALDATARLSWLSGFFQAYGLWDYETKRTKADPATLESYRVSMNFGEMNEVITTFYTDPLNRRIPLMFAIMWLHYKSKGESEIVLTGVINTGRKFAADNP